MQPKMMLFDEPTSALDPEMIKEVLDVMLGFARRHDDGRCVARDGLCAQCHQLRGVYGSGQIVDHGQPDHVFGTPQHERAKLLLSRILH